MYLQGNDKMSVLWLDKSIFEGICKSRPENKSKWTTEHVCVFNFKFKFVVKGASD